MKETLFERMGGTYRKESNYLLPNVAAPVQPTFDRLAALLLYSKTR